jgi:hypothetical protein
MQQKNEKLRDVCEEALTCLNKPGNSAYNEIKAKLEYVIGSYNYDKNPVGLYEIGHLALNALEEISNTKPRKVKKALLKNLKTALLQKVEA